MTGGQLVVGVDGSDGAAQALTWASEEACRRGDALLIVYASGGPDRTGLSAATAETVAAERAEYARVVLADARRMVRPGLSATPVHTEHVREGAVEALLRLSRAADLVVVGRGGSSEVLLGSVSQTIAAHAACPVVVTPRLPVPRGRSGRRPTVAVGVGRSPASMRALAAAFDHACRSGAEVLAVRAWGELDWAQTMSLRTPDAIERWRQASQHLLDDCVAKLGRAHPSVPVEKRLVRGPVAKGLLEAAGAADLLLLGSRRVGTPGLPQLGWMSTALLAQAPCPVEIVGRVPLREPRGAEVGERETERPAVGAGVALSR